MLKAPEIALKGGSMSKTQLINKVAEKVGIKKRQVRAVINSMIESIKEALERGEKVAIVGFGTFALANRAAREGRNPKTVETLRIPEKKVVRFRPGKGLMAIGK